MAMLDIMRSNLLKRKLHKIEQLLTARKLWGNNVTTLVVLNELVEDHMELFKSGLFADKFSGVTFQSSFNNLNNLVEWLVGLRNLLAEMNNNNVSEIPQNFSWLNVTELTDVNMGRFIRDDNGYNLDIVRSINHMRKKILEINQLYLSLSVNKRQYINMRLQNGLNTVLVIHEHILEAMVND